MTDIYSKVDRILDTNFDDSTMASAIVALLQFADDDQIYAALDRGLSDILKGELSAMWEDVGEEGENK